ncbi:MAG: STAS/SEC14 domain-containing protein [Pseudomonadota bacterium]|nr:STAS/SEC14 domain-containing protein [Pseudomonadota bacterium]
MLHHELLSERGILVVTPEGPLEKADFEQLTQVVDSFIADKGELNGLMIYTESFPGWSDFAALVTHLKFVKEHQKLVAKVAAVTDDGFLSVMPRIADYFVHAQVRHFDYADREAALAWLGDHGS